MINMVSAGCLAASCVLLSGELPWTNTLYFQKAVLFPAKTHTHSHRRAVRSRGVCIFTGPTGVQTLTLGGLAGLLPTTRPGKWIPSIKGDPEGGAGSPSPGPAGAFKRSSAWPGRRAEPALTRAQEAGSPGGSGGPRAAGRRGGGGRARPGSARLALVCHGPARLGSSQRGCAPWERSRARRPRAARASPAPQVGG